MANDYSLAPTGEKFPLPSPQAARAEWERLNTLTKQQKAKGREIVVVMGVGFVGAVMAAVIADSTDAKGKPGKFVIGVQRPSSRSFWKIPLINRGISPVTAEDPEVASLIKRCVLEKKTLTATYTMDALSLADLIIKLRLPGESNDVPGVLSQRV